MKKTTALPYKIIDANDLSGNFTSDPFDIRHLNDVVFHVVVAAGGDAVGVLDIEVSANLRNYKAQEQIDDADFIQLGSDYQAAVDGAGGGIFDLSRLGPVFVRIKYTRTSGSGSMDVYQSAKAS